MRIYIASPYGQGDIAVNVRESILVADRLAAVGFCPYVPLLNHFWHFLSPHRPEFWLSLDKEWVVACDGLLRLPGESDGADDEVSLAHAHRIPVFYSVEALIEQLQPISRV